MHIYASTVYEHISNGVYDVSLRRFEGNFKMFGGKMLVAEQLKRGILYLGVKTVTDSAVFSLSVRFYPAAQTILPFEAFFLPEDGLVQWRLDYSTDDEKEEDQKRNKY